MGYTIIFIMVSSIFGYMWVGNSQDVEKYNDFKFSKQGNDWVTKVDGEEVRANYMPQFVEDIKLDESVKKIFEQKVIQLTYDPTQDFLQNIAQSRFLLEKGLQKKGYYTVLGLKINTSMTDISMITCKDATANSPVIDFVLNNETKIVSEDNCVTVYSKDGIDFIRAKDRLLYHIFGVIDE